MFDLGAPVKQSLAVNHSPTSCDGNWLFMPPGPAYNWFCVLYSTSEIISHALRYRASQLTPRASSHVIPPKRRTEEPKEEEIDVRVYSEPITASKYATEPLLEKWDYVREEVDPSIAADASQSVPQAPTVQDLAAPVAEVEVVQEVALERTPIEDSLNSKLQQEVPNIPPPVTVQKAAPIDVPPTDAIKSYPIVSRNLQFSKVPASRIGRLFHYGGLAASLGYGAASEIIRRTGSSSEDQSSVMMTEANVTRLVSKLSQMRGAALKLGQFMSIQDTHVLPPDIDKVFRRVQDSAHYMPDWQMEKVMTTSLGPSWTANFDHFDRIPFAAASIGQVHTAVLSANVSPTGQPEPVAVKIQFPNIVNSINSDLGYIKMLLTAGKLLPKGLFLDKTIQVMKGELADECDYKREASFLKAFGSPEYLGNVPQFKVPWVWEGSTDTVLVMERMNGVSVGEANANNLSQQDRDDIAARIIELCLKELFEFRAMQTDPNWTNFLWNADTRQIELVDFGATRDYSKEFIDTWLRLLLAAASEDREACIIWSRKIGYLTGEESEIMLDAHVKSMMLLAAPFKAGTPQPFAFGQGTQWTDITAEIRAQIPVMLQHRLTPPPQETYSLNRKLSGAFLLASRLGARVNTKAIWDRIVGKYQFS